MSKTTTFALLVLTLCALVGTSADAQSRVEPADPITDALRLLQEDRFEESRRILRDAYARHPSPRLAGHLGMAELMNRNFVTAEQLLQTALAAPEGALGEWRDAFVESLVMASQRIGTLDVAGVAPGTQVSLDGTFLGVAPLAPRRVRIGPHRVVAGGVTRTVMVQAGETSVARFSAAAPQSIVSQQQPVSQQPISPQPDSQTPLVAQPSPASQPRPSEPTTERPRRHFTLAIGMEAQAGNTDTLLRDTHEAEVDDADEYLLSPTAGLSISAAGHVFLTRRFALQLRGRFFWSPDAQLDNESIRLYRPLDGDPEFAGRDERFDDAKLFGLTADLGFRLALGQFFVGAGGSAGYRWLSYEATTRWYILGAGSSSRNGGEAHATLGSFQAQGYLELGWWLDRSRRVEVGIEMAAGRPAFSSRFTVGVALF